MPHTEKHLAPGETIRYRARYHWLRNLKSLGLLNLFNEITVTDRRVLKKSGIFNIEIQSLPFANLEARDLKQGLWGRLLGFGDVTLFGTGGQSESFEHLSRPGLFLRQVDEAAEGEDRAPRAAKPRSLPRQMRGAK